MQDYSMVHSTDKEANVYGNGRGKERGKERERERERDTKAERGMRGRQVSDEVRRHTRSILETIASRIDRPARRVNDPPRALISAFERYRPRSVGGSFEFSHERISERTYRNTVHGGEYGMTNRCAEWPPPCEHTRPSTYLSIAFSCFSPSCPHYIEANTPILPHPFFTPFVSLRTLTAHRTSISLSLYFPLSFFFPLSCSFFKGLSLWSWWSRHSVASFSRDFVRRVVLLWWPFSFTRMSLWSRSAEFIQHPRLY